MTTETLLLFASLVLFILAAIGVGGRINLTAAGLACLVGSLLVPMV